MIRFDAKLLAAVSLAISTEETRYYLCGVYLEGNIAVATDSHMLTAAHDENSIIESPGIYPVSKKAIAAMKAKRADWVMINDNLLTVLQLDNSTPLYIEPCVAIDGTFPDWRKVVPKDACNPGLAAFANKLVSKVCDTAAILNAPSIRFTQQDTESTGSPNVVDYNDIRVFSVVMPMRAIMTPDTVHSWIHDYSPMVDTA